MKIVFNSSHAFCKTRRAKDCFFFNQIVDAPEKEYNSISHPDLDVLRLAFCALLECSFYGAADLFGGNAASADLQAINYTMHTRKSSNGSLRAAFVNLGRYAALKGNPTG
jgi:hypothetical protein